MSRRNVLKSMTVKKKIITKLLFLSKNIVSDTLKDV